MFHFGPFNPPWINAFARLGSLTVSWLRCGLSTPSPSPSPSIARRQWSTGDTVSLRLPMRWWLKSLPENRAQYHGLQAGAPGIT